LQLVIETASEKWLGSKPRAIYLSKIILTSKCDDTKQPIDIIGRHDSSEVSLSYQNIKIKMNEMLLHNATITLD
jgi:hypothetical protein